MSSMSLAIRPLLVLSLIAGSSDLLAQKAFPGPFTGRTLRASPGTLKTGRVQIKPPFRLGTRTPIQLRTPRRPLPTRPGTVLGRPTINPTPPARPVRPTSLPPVGRVVIRGIWYEDHSAGTRLAQSTVRGGAFFRINSSTMVYDGQIRVTMQDVTRGNGFGVTAFRLTNVRRSGNSLIVQAPNLPLLKNRTYHIAVFVYGTKNRTANAGRLTIQ